jgi:hypothetical protein
LSPLLVSTLVFAVIVGGVGVGVLLRHVLPEHHLAEDAKDVVRLGTGLVGTIAALVLGLLIASATSSYDTQSAQVQRVTADFILLDRLLEQYGPEALSARTLMRRALTPLVARIWRENGPANVAPFEATAPGEAAYAAVQGLSPQSEVQRLLKARAVEVSNDLIQTRLLLFVQADGSIPAPFLAVLVFWLAIIFASFSLFSRLNPTVIVALAIFALSAAGAIFLILELTQPFTGVMQISAAPLRNALPPL